MSEESEPIYFWRKSSFAWERRELPAQFEAEVKSKAHSVVTGPKKWNDKDPKGLKEHGHTNRCHVQGVFVLSSTDQASLATSRYRAVADISTRGVSLYKKIVPLNHSFIADYASTSSLSLLSDRSIIRGGVLPHREARQWQQAFPFGGPSRCQVF